MVIEADYELAVALKNHTWTKDPYVTTDDIQSVIKLPQITCVKKDPETAEPAQIGGYFRKWTTKIYVSVWTATYPDFETIEAEILTTIEDEITTTNTKYEITNREIFQKTGEESDSNKSALVGHTHGQLIIERIQYR